MIHIWTLLLPFLLFLPRQESSKSPGKISEKSIRQHIQTLSSDDFEGRKPFTNGETKTIDYLVNAAKKAGLQPGNGSSFTQDVPLTEITGHASATMELKGAASLSLKFREQYTVYTQRTVPEVSLNGSDLVFCGYGIVAPEYGWNDYAGLDMKGKTALILVNDPGFGSEDSTFSKATP